MKRSSVPRSRSFPFKERISRPSAWLICLAGLALLFLACNLPGAARLASPPGTQGSPGVPGGGTAPDDLDKAMTLDQALAIQQTDSRPQVLQQMGQPDAFEITYAELNGKPVREEEWSYFDDQKRFDFVNGALLWTVNIDPMPDFSLNAAVYDPLSFTDGMSTAEAQALLKGQQLSEFDLADYAVPGGQALAGDQILLGFDGGKLVYVRTFELAPEGES